MTLGEQVAAVRRALHRKMRARIAARSDHPFTQLLALRAIEVEGLRTQSELAERLLVDAAAVSRLVDRLEEEGLVKRCAGENRRCVSLQLTAPGRSAVSRLGRDLEWLEEDLRRHLSETEAKTLSRLLTKLQQGLSEETRDPVSD